MWNRGIQGGKKTKTNLISKVQLFGKYGIQNGEEMTFYRKVVSIKTVVEKWIGAAKNRIALFAKVSLTV